MITPKNPYDSWLILNLKFAKAILFCHWDLCQNEKSMPKSLNLDRLPI